MKLYDVAKLTQGKIRIFDWKNRSKNIYDNYLYIPNELRNRRVVMIDTYGGMVEFTLAYNKQ